MGVFHFESIYFHDFSVQETSQSGANESQLESSDSQSSAESSLSEEELIEKTTANICDESGSESENNLPQKTKTGKVRVVKRKKHKKSNALDALNNNAEKTIKEKSNYIELLEPDIEGMDTNEKSDSGSENVIVTNTIGRRKNKTSNTTKNKQKVSSLFMDL